MESLGRIRSLGEEFRPEKLGHGGGAKTECAATEKLSPGHVEIVFARRIHSVLKVGLEEGKGDIAGEHGGDHLGPSGELDLVQGVVDGGFSR